MVRVSRAMPCLWCTAMNAIITNTVHIRGSHWMLFWGCCLRVLIFFWRRDCRPDISLQSAALRPLIYDVNDWGVSAALTILPKGVSNNTLPWKTWPVSCSCWSGNDLHSIVVWPSVELVLLCNIRDRSYFIFLQNIKYKVIATSGNKAHSRYGYTSYLW